MDETYISNFNELLKDKFKAFLIARDLYLGEVTPPMETPAVISKIKEDPAVVATPWVVNIEIDNFAETAICLSDVVDIIINKIGRKLPKHNKFYIRMWPFVYQNSYFDIMQKRYFLQARLFAIPMEADKIG